MINSSWIVFFHSVFPLVRSNINRIPSKLCTFRMPTPYETIAERLASRHIISRIEQLYCYVRTPPNHMPFAAATHATPPPTHTHLNLNSSRTIISNHITACRLPNANAKRVLGARWTHARTPKTNEHLAATTWVYRRAKRPAACALDARPDRPASQCQCRAHSIGVNTKYMVS